MQTNIRFFRVQTDCTLKRLLRNATLSQDASDDDIISIAHVSGDVEPVLDVFFKRSIQVSSREIDGTLALTMVDTIEKIKIRFFQSKKDYIMAAFNPPRGSKYADHLLEIVLAGHNFFYESMEITEPVIRRHVAKFDVARLVSAKVRDFSVYEGAVARLEITSKDGLKPEIAPFLPGRHYKLDAATYEVTHKFSSFLVTYTNAGTLKVNEQFLESVLPRFVALL